MRLIFLLSFVLCAVFFCGSATSQPTVAIHPVNAAITIHQSQQYTASSTVTWFVDGIAGGNSTVGMISSSGLYHPPTTVGAHTIKAVLTSNTAVSASAKIYVENQPGVFTYHFNSKRSGTNDKEIALSPSNVTRSTFGKLFSRSVDGRVYAQPLYFPNLSIPNKGTFNVVYVATEHDSLYAFDADGKVSTPLWKRSFINPSAGITTVPGSAVNNFDIGPEIGITATPVIDPTTKTMYVVVRTYENSVSVFRLHALDVSTGAEKLGGPVRVTATVDGTGDGSVNGQIAFNPLRHNTRTGLLDASGKIYFGFASQGDVDPYHGWIFCYSASTIARVAVLNTTPNGHRGGVWQSDAGLAYDGTSIYIPTGNGTNNVTGSATDYGDTVLKLSTGLSITDFFTPTDQAALNSGDLDLASAAPVILPTQSNTSHPNLLVTSNKRGDIYLIDRDALGHFLPNSTSNLVQFLPRAVGANSSGGDQFFGIAAYWSGFVYFAGSFDHLKQFRLSNGLLSTTPFARSSAILSSSRSAEPVVSSNGGSNGVVWVIDTTNVSSGTIPAVLHAFKASNVGTELYNSNQSGTRDQPGPSVKFSSPTIANGKVFVPTKNQLNVYGFLP